MIYVLIAGAAVRLYAWKGWVLLCKLSLNNPDLKTKKLTDSVTDFRGLCQKYSGKCTAVFLLIVTEQKRCEYPILREQLSKWRARLYGHQKSRVTTRHTRRKHSTATANHLRNKHRLLLKRQTDRDKIHHMGLGLRLWAISFSFFQTVVISKHHFYKTGLWLLAPSFNCFGVLFFRASFSGDLRGPTGGWQRGDRMWNLGAWRWARDFCCWP